MLLAKIDELNAWADGFRSKSTGRGAMNRCIRLLDGFSLEVNLCPM
jgi:hypothetical protein